MAKTSSSSENRWHVLSGTMRCNAVQCNAAVSWFGWEYQCAYVGEACRDAKPELAMEEGRGRVEWACFEGSDEDGQRVYVSRVEPGR